MNSGQHFLNMFLNYLGKERADDVSKWVDAKLCKLVKAETNCEKLQKDLIKLGERVAQSR